MTIKTLTLLSTVALCVGGCATHPKTYHPPDPARLNASTARVAKAVESAHAHAKSAQQNVKNASETAKAVREEVKALPDVPVTLSEKINTLESQLALATKDQIILEADLTTANTAKAQVEKDKADYFVAGQKLADDASAERDQRIAVEKKLSWYRWHWWGSWIVLGLGVLACGVFAFLKFTGRLALAGAAISAKIP